MKEEGRGGDVNERDGGGEGAEAEDGPAETQGVAPTGVRCLWDFRRKFHAREFAFMVLSLE